MEIFVRNLQTDVETPLTSNSYRDTA